MVGLPVASLTETKENDQQSQLYLSILYVPIQTAHQMPQWLAAFLNPCPILIPRAVKRVYNSFRIGIRITSLNMS